MSERPFTSNGSRPSSEQELRAALDEANIPTLVMVVTQLTGEDRWLKPPYRPKKGRPLDDNDSGGLPEEIQREVREAALCAVLAYRAGDLQPMELTPERVAQMLAVALDEEVPEDYGPLLAEELGIEARDVEIAPAPPEEDFRVIVIGSGLSGLCAAIKLQAAGIAYTVIEKNPSLGGTWFENVYPGCGVDTPSHLYSFSFAMNTEWPRYFAQRPDVYEYLERLADRYQVRDNVEFETEVTSAEYDADEAMWHVCVRRADGTEETLTANAVITAVGMVNRPFIPPIEGLESFEGPMMHTAQWRPDADVAGTRVAVIGTGASSMQLVPAIADEAEEVIVFQRSPQWALPHPNYKREVSEAVRLLLDQVPFYAGWYRLRAFWNFGDRLYDALMIDPDWPHPERSINAINERHRVFLTNYVKEQLGEHVDELLDACLPDYPPYGKRPLIDNGWFRTVCRDDVQLVTEAVTAVRPRSVITTSGCEFQADVIVLATGFRTLQFLWPMEIRGRSGRTLREAWGEEDARALLGITVPDFPNFFMLNGPNTSAGHGGSAVIATEFQMRYVMQLLGHMIEHGLASVECRKEAFAAYQDELDAALARTIWSHRGMTTYYRNSEGRIVTASPWKYVDYWNRTRTPSLDDFEFECEPRLAGSTTE